MKRWWTRRWRTALIVVGALAILIAGTLVLKWVGLDPNAFAAVASALAAIAAFASARESSTTARDAIRALSYTSKPAPRLNLTNNARVAIIVTNDGPDRITRGTLRWKLRNGQRGSCEIDAIPGRRPATWDDSPSIPYLVQPAPEHTGLIAEASLDYWGANGPIGWRLTYTYLTGARPPQVTDTELS